MQLTEFVKKTDFFAAVARIPAAYGVLRTTGPRFEHISQRWI